MSKPKKILLWIFVALMFINFDPLAAEDRISDAVRQVSQKALPDWLRDIPIEDLSHFGFNSQDELLQAEAGIPFQIHTIHPNDFLNFYFTKGMAELLRETGMWYVPIMVNGECRLLMTVARLKEAWEAVEISGADLASEIGDFFDNSKRLMNLAGISGDYSFKFVRVFQASSDFIYLETTAGDHLKLFKSAQMALDIPAEILINPQIIIPKLMSVFERNFK